MSVVQLVAGTNGEGFLHSLAKVFAALKTGVKPPTKGALSIARKQIHYSYFRDAFRSVREELDKKAATFMGLRIYAIDGQQLTLPREPSIVAEGFNGRAVSKHRESYYPKGFLTHAYDVLNGFSKDFTLNPILHEQADARTLLQGFEQESLTIYDRLHFSVKMVAAHLKHGSYFLMRCRSNCHKTVIALLNSKKKIMTGKIAGKRIHFVKIWNTKTKEWDVFATNLPKRFISRSLILKLYRLRWEVETSFKELTAITKAEQWHTKSFNGIMQELYALMWLINATKGIVGICGKKPLDPLRRSYEKPNFKLVFNMFASRIYELWYRFRELIAWLGMLVKESTEKRKRYSRRYPRQLRKPATPYPYNNTEWFWDKRSELN